MRTEAVVNSQGQTGYLTKGKVLFMLKYIFNIYLSKCIVGKMVCQFCVIGLSLKFKTFE